MKVKTVQDSNNVRWECAQAYAAVAGKAADNAAQDSAANSVDVVCTPSGGAQTIRLRLPGDWFDKMSDEQLVEAIEQEG